MYAGYTGAGWCLSRDGGEEFEPLPSSRDEAFTARCRFASREEAFAAAHGYLGKKEYPAPEGT